MCDHGNPIWRTSKTGVGPRCKWASKFDLYRRMGFVFDKPESLQYRVPEYEQMMTLAYEEVLPAKGGEHA